MEYITKNIKEMEMRMDGVVNSAKGDRVRIMLVSTHINQVTGYSKVSFNLVKQLASVPSVDLIHYGFQKFGGGKLPDRDYPAGVEVIDVGAAPGPGPTDGGFGFAGLPQAIRTHRPDILMIYNDLSIVSQYLEAMRKAGIDRTFKVWIYADQIYTQQQQVFLDIVNRDADRVFVFSEYWRDILKRQGVHRPIHILNHGFEAAAFPVLDKKAVRKQLGLPEDAFVLMSLNRNQPRKRLDLLIMAFAELIVKHPQKPVYMIMVCDKGEKGGWDLFNVYAREIKGRGGMIDVLGSRLMITSKDMTYTDADINALYNIADVGVSCAEGEGWGLCSFEMMGVGKPQVLSDVGGHKEYCVDGINGAVVPVRGRYYLPRCYCALGGEAAAVDPSEFCAAMERYVMDSELLERHGAAARAKVLEYSWETVTTGLKKLIARELEGGDV